MSEVYKSIIGFVLLVVLCGSFFLWGYLLSNSRATKRINEANNELAEQQQKYDTAIREAEERVRDIRNKLLEQVSNNGEAAAELSKLVEQIRKQKLDI